ncbi:related to Syntaxin-8 [Zygosaccharomyces bailii ISA1307]|nr:related to Syntaxin-8 [Zygosaccharomyces bailii ISA1307]
MEALQLSYELDKLGDIVEERKRLVTVLKIEPSANDNIKLKKQLSKTLDLLTESKSFDTVGVQEFESRYSELLNDISDEALDLELYQLPKLDKSKKRISKVDDSNTIRGTSPSRDLTKKVRFKDEDLVSYEDQVQQFEPYTDNPEGLSALQDSEEETQRLFNSPAADGGTATIISPQVSNQELFIQQQQQILEQDSHLERLSSSIRTTHNISLSINDEVTDQNDQVLNDLENLLDNGGRNLDRAKRRLMSFERSAKENAPCFIIFVLILILILLLAVL